MNLRQLIDECARLLSKKQGKKKAKQFLDDVLDDNKEGKVLKKHIMACFS